MTQALLDRPLGELAASIPGATALFHRYQLDFCCGGRKSLRDAAGEGATRVAGELQTLQQTGTLGRERDWRDAGAAELIDHILGRYHERHRQQLPELLRLARRVEQVHAGRDDCPHGLADHLEDMLLALEEHMQKEEQVLFPLLRHGSAALVQGPVEALRDEHLGHGEALERMVALAHGLQPPADACNTWRALHAGLRVLREDLMQHIHL
jgi:regulator of cell morphogenesis and NO signaling